MNFFTILLSNDNDNTITDLIKNKKTELDIFHLNQHSELITTDSIFFICIGGDKTKSESWWLKNNNDKLYKGLKFIASLIERPSQYDPNDTKNFKIRIKVQYTFLTPIKKEDFIYWPDSYDTDASVATKGKQTQAIGLLRDEKKYLGLLRGAMFYDRNLKKFYSDFFGQKFLEKIEAPQKRFVEKHLSYSEELNLPKSNANQDHFPHTPTQTIYYGVPGSGKSHKIDEKTKGLPDEQKIRVVFHPEYTNADFVGQILPKVKNGSVEYEFKPGPFTKILYRAYHNYNTPYCLIIEEINRGNAAAIFGDVFQLLDRIKKGDAPENVNGNTFGEGWSKYFVENEFINNYLRSPVEYSKEGFTENHDKKSVTFKSGITFSENTGIRLPPNLSIYATMNTSDQNVFTLDNAFQRRWDMELVPNKCEDSSQMNAKITVNNQSITWKDFQTQINSIIGEKSNDGLSSMEDKRLGCWFIKAENGVIDEKHFANKVLKYLWDDSFKFCHQEIFESDIKNFEELQNRFLETGFDIFSENCGLKNYLSNNQSASESQSNPVNPQDSEPSEENSEQ